MSATEIAGQVVRVVLPDDTAYSKVQANLAIAARVLAEQAAGIATAIAQGRYYSSYAAGNAATTAGQYFGVFSGGNYSFHVNGNATPVFVMPKIDAAGNLSMVGSGNQVFNMTGPKGGFGITVDGTNNAGGTTITYSFAAGGQGPLKIANASGEVARWGPDGSLGIGTTSPAAPLHVKSFAETMRLETTAARGSSYVRFTDPTGSKAFLGYTGANDTFSVHNELGSISFVTSGNTRWLMGSTSLYPNGDNTDDIAGPSNRVKNLYLVNSPIVTSDEREKDWLGCGFNDAELRAAKRIAAEIGSYHWLASLAAEEDGGDPTHHFGVRAQAAWGIMADEGLIDPIVDGERPSSRYAFLCYDEWAAAEAVEELRDDDDTIIRAAVPAIEAGYRFGIRPDQLTMFLIAAQEARLLALEAAA